MGSISELCVEIAEVLMCTTIAFSDRNLLGLEGSIDDYAKDLKEVAAKNRLNRTTLCSVNNCACCADSLRPQPETIINEFFEKELHNLWSDGLCVKCVKEHQPFYSYERACELY
jgi:hypothetical protein